MLPHPCTCKIKPCFFLQYSSPLPINVEGVEFAHGVNRAFFVSWGNELWRQLSFSPHIPRSPYSLCQWYHCSEMLRKLVPWGWILPGPYMLRGVTLEPWSGFSLFPLAMTVTSWELFLLGDAASVAVLLIPSVLLPRSKLHDTVYRPDLGAS